MPNARTDFVTDAMTGAMTNAMTGAMADAMTNAGTLLANSSQLVFKASRFVVCVKTHTVCYSRVLFKPIDEA